MDNPDLDDALTEAFKTDATESPSAQAVTVNSSEPIEIISDTQANTVDTVDLSRKELK